MTVGFGEVPAGSGCSPLTSGSILIWFLSSRDDGDNWLPRTAATVRGSSSYNGVLRHFLATLKSILSYAAVVSRGLGSLQRKVLDALVDRRDNDTYDAADVSELIDPDDTPLIRARWRWYTVDLLDLTEVTAPRPDRVSLHRAIRSLHQTGQVEIATACPYPTILGGCRNDYGHRVGGLYVPKLSYHIDIGVRYRVDARWPYTQGRRLWFRLPPPTSRNDIPADDQIAVIDCLHTNNPKEFQDFTEKLRTRKEDEAWTSAIGRFVSWLFCGSPA